MPLFQRATENGIEFVNQEGETVIRLKDDGTIWGASAPVGGAGAPGPQGLPGQPGPAGADGTGIQAQAVAITPPKDLASCVAAVRAIINVLHDAGITV